jgi:hypothetical protein
MQDHSKQGGLRVLLWGDRDRPCSLFFHTKFCPFREKTFHVPVISFLDQASFLLFLH